MVSIKPIVKKSPPSPPSSSQDCSAIPSVYIQPCPLHSLFLSSGVYLLRLAEKAAGKVPLAEVVLNSALLGGSGLREGCRAAEGAGESGVLHAHDADVCRATGCALAGHTSRHGDGYWEILYR